MYNLDACATPVGSLKDFEGMRHKSIEVLCALLSLCQSVEGIEVGMVEGTLAIKNGRRFQRAKGREWGYPTRSTIYKPHYFNTIHS